VAAGHFRNGILLAPATAQAMAELILGETPVLDLEPFRPQRFPEYAA
jgi:glycine oxidase